MDYYFDEQSFVEHFHPDYNCDEIAEIDDISCVLDRDYGDDPDKIARLAEAGYFGMSEDELKAELKRLEGQVLADAMAYYLEHNYGISL